MEGCMMVLKNGTRDNITNTMGKETPSTPMDFLILRKVLISLSVPFIICSFFMLQKSGIVVF